MRTFLWVASLVFFIGLSIWGTRYYRDGRIHHHCAELFDADYYVARYPEVKSSGLSPFKHYMTVGYKEMKNPYAMFDAAFYCATYCYEPWFVTKRPKNPLVNYVRFGKRKGHITHPLLVKKVKRLENPKYDLCVVAMFRDEAPYLKEWIEYYLMMGVQHFFLTNHFSRDRYQQVLKPYIEKGLVTLYEVPLSDRRHFDTIKAEAYDAAIRYLRDKAEWLAIIDTDEFVMPVKDDNLVSVLKHYDHHPAVFFKWKCFGTSDLFLKKGDLLTEKLVWRERLVDHGEYPCGMKSFVKPRYVKKADGQHLVSLYDGYFYGNPVLGEKPVHPQVVVYQPWRKDSLAFIYHYTLRDEHFWRQVKGPRTLRQRREEAVYIQKRKKQYKAVVDTSMHRFVPELKRRMAAQ